MSMAGTTRNVALAAPGASMFASLGPRAAQAFVVAVACAAFAVGFMATSGSAHAVAQAGPDLTRLLRGMAALKARMALGAGAAVLWRLQTPVSGARFSLYAASVAGMAAGPGLIWQMVHIVSGAALLHAGLILCIVLLWRDPGVGQRLEQLVARKRAALRL